MISKQLRILIISLLSIAILLLGFISSYNNYIENIKNQQKNLIEKINTIKSNLDALEIIQLGGNLSDTNNQSYLSLQQKLTALNNSNTDVRYIYLMGMRDSVLFFYIDSQADNRMNFDKSNLALPGEIYKDAPKEFYKAYYNQSELICGPYEDKWGEFISIVTPIKNPKNKEIIALIGVDVLYDDFISVFQVKTLTPILFSVLIILVFIIIYLLFGQKFFEDNEKLQNLTKIKNSLNHFRESVIIVNKNLEIFYINPAASFIIQSISGFNLKEFDNLLPIFNEGLSNDISHKITEIFKSGINPEDFNGFYTQIKDKRVFIKISPIFSKDNEIEQLILNIVQSPKSKPAIDKEDDFNEEKLILEHINEVVWQLNFEGVIISVSNSVNNLLGYDVETLVFGNIERILSQNSYLKLKNTLQRIYETGRKTSKLEEILLILQVFRPNKQLLDVEVRLIMKSNKSNEPVGVILVMRKVNENIDAILELYETKKAIQTYFNHIPGVIYRCAIDRNWTMKFISNGCYDLTGFQVEDFIDNKTIAFNDIILPEYKELLWSKWQKVIEKGGLFEGQYQITTAQGNVKWVFEKGRCVYDENGLPVALEGFILDVSDKIKSEELLKRNEQRFRDYLESTSLAIFVTDSEGLIKDFNKSLSNMTGIEKINLYNKPFFELVDADFLERSKMFFENLKNRQIIETVVKIKTKNSSLYVSVYASHVYESQYIFYLINNQELINKNNQLIGKINELSQSIELLPMPVYIINTTNRITIAKSKLANENIQNSICPCSVLKEGPDFVCNLIHKKCSINQMLDSKEIVVSSFSESFNDITKFYKVVVAPVFSDENHGTVSHALVTVFDETKIITLENKLSAASKSLDNMFTSHFLNIQSLIQKIQILMSGETIEANPYLRQSLNHEYQNANFLSSLFLSKETGANIVFSPSKLILTVFENVKKQKSFFVANQFFFFDDLPENYLLNFSEQSLKLLLELTLNYSVSHSVNHKIKIKQFEGADNHLFFDFIFKVDDLCYNQIEKFKTIDIFTLFQTLDQNHQSVFDFAFLKKICSCIDVKIDLFLQKSNYIICRFAIKNNMENHNKTGLLEKSIQNVFIINSDKEILYYQTEVLSPLFKNIKVYSDYLLFIKELMHLSNEERPNIIIIDDFVNNVNAIDILKKIKSEKLFPNTHVIITHPCFNLPDLNSDNYYNEISISLLSVPYLKNDLLGSVQAKI